MLFLEGRAIYEQACKKGKVRIDHVLIDVMGEEDADVAADLVRPRRKSGPDVAKSRGFSPGYVGLNFLL